MKLNEFNQAKGWLVEYEKLLAQREIVRSTRTFDVSTWLTTVDRYARDTAPVKLSDVCTMAGVSPELLFSKLRAQLLNTMDEEIAKKRQRLVDFGIEDV
jgi:hypothetical protein